MNRITKILLISAVGILAIPLISLAACGPRPDCADCVSTSTCEAELLCSWDSIEVECVDQTISPVSSGDITTLTGHVSDLFSDIKLLVLLVIGVPLAFYVIGKALGIMPRK